MKFIISSTELVKNIQAISGVISGNSNTMPILDNFLMVLENNSLTITASDLETTITCKCDVESDSSWEFTVSSKLFTEIIKSFPDQPLTFIQKNESQIEIISEQGNYVISYEGAEDYPSTPIITEGDSVQLNSNILLEAIKTTSFATGNDALRPVMTGVFFELSSNEGCNFVATDAHRLVKYTRTDVLANQNTEFIVPKKSLNLLKNIFVLISETPVRVEFNSTNVRFSFNETVFVCRLIDGKYPKYDAVIPKENPNVMTINRESLLNSLRRVSIFSNKSSHLIRLKITGNLLVLSAEDVDYANKAEEKLPCSYVGDDIEIGFNSKFLKEMLSNIYSEDISLELSHPSRAGIIKPTNGIEESEDVLMLMMPLILN
jgi:DNA polymerase III subunit beta